ncbi:MAG: 30S ribosome-binding factor RbfA [Chloroflexi bacterium]|nr:30S ribosome-binding factor RbfA [Chloroflexota bacterium]
MTRRTQQMGEFLREEVVDIIRSEIDDPRLGFWTVTRVEVLPDFRSARIYVSVLGTDGERKETLTALRGAAGFIRSHLKPRMRTRIIPDLDFRDDRSMEHAEEIDRTLRALRGEKGGEGGRSAPGGRFAEEEETLERTLPRASSPLERSDSPQRSAPLSPSPEETV